MRKGKFLGPPEKLEGKKIVQWRRMARRKTGVCALARSPSSPLYFSGAEPSFFLSFASADAMGVTRARRAKGRKKDPFEARHA